MQVILREADDRFLSSARTAKRRQRRVAPAGQTTNNDGPPHRRQEEYWPSFVTQTTSVGGPAKSPLFYFAGRPWCMHNSSRSEIFASPTHITVSAAPQRSEEHKSALQTPMYLLFPL